LSAVGPPRLQPGDRVLLAVLSRVLPLHRWDAFFVTPATLLRWHRELVARKWAYPRKHPGRHSTRTEIRQLIPSGCHGELGLGQRRIHSELVGLGFQVSPAAVWRIRRAAGTDPAHSGPGHSWTTFLRAQATSLPVDLFTVDTALLQQIHSVFAIEIATRRVHLLGITRHPTGAWATQAARNLVTDLDEASRSFRFLARDRDTNFAESFDAVLPPPSPRSGWMHWPLSAGTRSLRAILGTKRGNRGTR
jgi:putative transposase